MTRRGTSKGRRLAKPAASGPADGAVRLHKVLAEAGVASRRQCESMIEQGRVSVNGSPVTTLPAWVDPRGDRVEVDGQQVMGIGPSRRPRANAAEVGGRRVWVALNKPRRVISTSHDPQGRRTVTDLVDLPKALAKRVYPVGRLDADSGGLILLTNDGEAANRLTHPRYGVAKRYRVSVRGRLAPEDLERLKRGLYLADRAGARGGARGAVRAGNESAKRARMAQVRMIGFHRDRARGDQTQLMVTLHEGQNREIRRMLARLGHKVRRLERVAMGPITVKGLAAGQWRLLRGPEVQALRHAAGL